MPFLMLTRIKPQLCRRSDDAQRGAARGSAQGFGGMGAKKNHCRMNTG